MSVPLIALKNVSAGYDGREVLCDLSLEVQRADFMGITGPNGGGKTTLIKLLVGLIEPTGGTIERNTRKIGYLPQQNLFDRNFPITVGDVVLSGLQGRGKKISREDVVKARNLLTDNGIPELDKRPIGELSGGQMQRVLLCRALISEPELLVLDEPATFIDQKFETELYETLAELNKKMAIVMVSHDGLTLAKIASRTIEIA